MIEFALLKSEFMVLTYMKNKFHFFLLIANLFIIGSCEEQEDEFGLRGKLIGTIETFDEFGEPLNDHSGYEVTIEGTDPLMKTVTDASGEFVFYDLATGTYNFIFQKDHFQTRKIFSYRFIGGNVPTYFETLYLYQLPTTTITSFKAYVTDENNPDPDRYTVIHIEYDIAQASSYEQPRYVAVFLGSSADVSGEKYDHQINLGFGAYDYRIDKLPPGTKWYAKAYAVPVSCNGYYDYSRSAYINSCLGMSSEKVEIVVP